MKKWPKIFIVIFFIAILFGPSFVGYLKYSQNLYVYNDDAVQYIPPFFHYQKNNTMAPDYFDQYYLDVIYPEGYKMLFATMSKYFSPILISKIVPVFTMFVFLVFVAAIVWRFGGATAGFSALCLVLSGQVFLAKMGGGLPRAFGFPILAAALLAGMYGRIYLLALITVVGAMFYPVTGLISGVFLSSLLLVPNKFTAIKIQWNYKKRCGFLCLIAVVAGSLLIPQILRGGEYGERISANNINQFPEADAGGRYSFGESLENTFFLHDFVNSVVGGMFGSGLPFVANMSLRSQDVAISFVLSVIVLIIIASFRFTINSWKTRNYAAVAYSLFFYSFIFCYLLSIVFLPYLYFPKRYFTYAIPLFCVTIIPILLTAKYRILANKQKMQSVLAVSVTGLIVLLFGGQIDYGSGLIENVARYKPLFDYVGTLPENVLIVGWPKKKYIDGLTYVTGRDIFLSFEFHQVLHSDFVKRMRERTYPLVDAYLATDLEPLIKLRDDFGVDYIIVDSNDFKDIPPRYFQPFDDYIAEKWKNANDRNLSFALPALKSKAVFTNGNIFVIDLNFIK